MRVLSQPAARFRVENCMSDLRVDPQDRHDQPPHGRVNGGSGTLVVVVAAVVAALGAVYWFYGREVPVAEPAADAPGPVAPAAVEDEGPAFPLPSGLPERVTPDNLMPLPALDDSDRYFELSLADILGSGIGELLVDSALIEKFVATIDNLPRDTVAERIRPVGRLERPFAADGQDGSGEFMLNPANYDRYDLLVNMLARADQAALVDTYQRFYPLFQEAYEKLGYPDAYFNDRVIEVIDHLLQTPEVDQPVMLVQPNVLYEYANPALESLSAGQKLMIRIGPDHAVRVKQFLEEMRDRLTFAPE